ncbi:uncharacterized protein LOC132106145 isoform X1 [Carassius carassius]|uniref:uncharacterized protein LOC132106145 isoform X1 n=1 Tax=Carassius carassius TaxID=217509 RepID=UPI002869329B|nr:uncharacterized protein LOC132106145 isoform X1 [Carassius carassius]
MKRQYEKAKRQKKVAKERILTQLKDTLRKPLHSTPCRTNPLHSEEEVESETVDTNVDLFNYPGNSQSTKQKKVAIERVPTQLKDTLRKPLHSDPRRTNPIHSEEEVESETVDTNVDLFDYPENFQPTDTLDAAEASGESVEQPLFVSGEVLKALKEISTVAFGILFLPHLRCVFTRITCGVHQEWNGTCIRIEPIWYKGHGFGARIYTKNTLQSGTIVRYACSLGTHNM